MTMCFVPFFGHCDLDLSLRFLEHNVLYYLRQEAQI